MRLDRAWLKITLVDVVFRQHVEWNLMRFLRVQVRSWNYGSRVTGAHGLAKFGRDWRWLKRQPQQATQSPSFAYYICPEPKPYAATPSEPLTAGLNFDSIIRGLKQGSATNLQV